MVSGSITCYAQIAGGWLHTELIPYMYTYVVNAHNGGQVLQRPVDGKYHYMFGDDFLVAPIYQDQLQNEITLPKGKK